MPSPIIRHLHLSKTLTCSPEAGVPGQVPSSGGPGPDESRIWLLPPDEILEEFMEDGPRLKASFPRNWMSLFPTGSLEPGDYLFCQWRQSDYPSLERGLEEFMRQVWWDGEETTGPWILRLVHEDGKLAIQGLRRVQEG